MEASWTQERAERCWIALRENRPDEALEQLNGVEDSDEKRALRIDAFYLKRAWRDALACDPPEGTGALQTHSLTVRAVCKLRLGEADAARQLISEAWMSGRISRPEMQRVYASLARLLGMEGPARMLEYGASEPESRAFAEMCAHVEGGGYDSAIALAERHKDRLEVQLCACFALSMQGKREEAEARLDALIDGADDVFKPFLGEVRAHLLLMHGKPEAALDAEGIEDSFLRLDALAQLNRCEEARELAARLASEDASAEARLSIAQALMRVGAWTEAAELVQAREDVRNGSDLSLRMKYALARSLTRSGEAQRGRAQYEALMDELKRLYRAQPQRVGCQALLLRCCRDLGLEAQAREIEEFLELLGRSAAVE